jgi:hypothetical protein
LRRAAAGEGLDDDHAAAAAGAGMLWCLRFVGGGAGGFDGVDGKYGQREPFAGARDVLGTLAAGEQAIVADAMEARRQHMRERLGGTGAASWTEPKGSYFISLDVLSGCAKTVAELAPGLRR